MRRPLSIVWLIAASFAAASLSACAEERPPQRIILIVVDTLRQDHLSPYNSEISTPNVQALADRGQVFSHYVASFHQTTMSMGALFTGLTPSTESENPRKPLAWTGKNWCGLKRFARSPEDACVPAHLTTLAEGLQEAGFFTAGVVSNSLLFAPAGFEQGFDRWVEIGPEDTQNLAPRERPRHRAAHLVRSAVHELFAELPPEPLFLYVHYVDVHDWTYVEKEYTEAVTEMDEELGKLIDELEKEGLLENATVILTSDHGEALGEPHALKTTKTHLGNPSFESVLQIPLVVAPPVFEDTEQWLRSQDLGALIAQLAGVAPAADAVEEGGLAADELVLSEDHYFTYRKGRWKSMFHRTRPKLWALFDLEADPGETVNRVKDEPAIVEQHLRRLAELNQVFRTKALVDEEQTDRDRARLRALGYLADAPDAPEVPEAPEAPEKDAKLPGDE